MSSKIKIMFLYSATDFGGLVSNLARTINHLNLNRFEVYLVSLEDNNPCEELLKVDVHLKRLNCKKRIDFDVVKKLTQLISSEGIQIVNADGYKADFYALLARCNTKFKLACIIHGWVGLSTKLFFYQLLDKLIIGMFDRIILVSPAQMIRHKFLHLYRSKIRVVPNAINVQDFNNLAKQPRNTDEFIIGCCSRLAPEKCILDIIKACKNLININWKLHIIGAGEEEGKLKEYVERVHLSEKITFYGYQPKVAGYMANFDIFVSASKIEGLPNSVLEAGALGLPVILSDIPEHQVLVNDSNGVLFKQGDSTDLANKIIMSYENPSLRDSMGEKFHETIRTKYSIEQKQKLLEKTYEELLC